MSYSLACSEIYHFDQLISNLTDSWRGALRSLPQNFVLSPAFTFVLPRLKLIYQWSVSLTSPDYPVTSLEASFSFSLDSWNTLVHHLAGLAELFREISPLLPEYPKEVKTCYKDAEDNLVALYKLLERWSELLDLTSDSDVGE